MPATSPTLSPTLSAMVAGLRGSSSGMFGLDLADEIGADVGGLGVDPAADPGEQGLRRGAHAERDHRGRDDDEVMPAVRQRVEMTEDDEPDRDVEQGQADDDQAHDRAAAESDPQAGVERVLGRVGRPRRGVRRGLHPEESGQAGEEPAGEEGHRDPWILDLEDEGHEGQQEDQADKDHGDDLVLLFEVRHGTLADVGGDPGHMFGALAFLLHLMVEEPGEKEGARGPQRGEQEKRVRHRSHSKDQVM